MRALRFALAAVFACVLCGAWGAELRIAVSRGPVSLPVYVAESQGLFRKEGVTVKLDECASGRECVEQLAAGRADLATAAELPVTLHSLRADDLAIVATISTSSTHIKLVGRRSAGVTSPASLRGKAVATVQGSSAQYFLDHWLLYHGVDPATVHVVPMAPDRMAVALARHDVDAIAIWEPVASTAIGALGPDAWTQPSPKVYTQHFNLVASRRAIRDQGDQIVAVLRALGAADRFIADRPAQARAVLAERVPEEGGGERLGEHDFHLRLEQTLITTMDAQARWASPGAAQRGNLMRSIDPSLLRQAVPGAVNLVQ